MRNLTKSENSYCLIWAKKIKAIGILGGKCEKCGNNNIFHLEFHHKNNEEKEASINELKSLRWSIILKEIKKCNLLCGNCHKELHNKGSENGIRKKKFMLNRKLIKCSKCGYAGKNFSSLSFHHNDKLNKKFTINSALIRSVCVSEQELEDELLKCSVLCQNCHVVEHILVDKFEKYRDFIYQKVNNYKENRRPIDEQKIKQMIKLGMRQSEICKKLNSPKSTIGTIVKRLINNGELNKTEIIVKNNIVCSKKYLSIN